MEKDSDLRVVKTRANLRKSLLSLLEKKPISEITVTEICDGAACGRNTFYLHYPYKEALYEQLLDESIAKVESGFYVLERMPGETEEEYIGKSIHNAVTAMYNAKDILRTILASDSTHLFCRRLTTSVRKCMLEGSRPLSEAGTDSPEYQLISHYCASGIVGFLLGCFEDERISAAQAEEVLRSLHTAPFAVGYHYLTEYKT